MAIEKESNRKDKTGNKYYICCEIEDTVNYVYIQAIEEKIYLIEKRDIT